ncbi:MAG: PilZ domain-containing protein [Aureliella sp.]
MQTVEQNKRAAVRNEVRTTATIFCDCGAGWQILRGWTDDISSSGMKVRTEREIRRLSVYVRMAMPGVTDKLFSAKVVREQYGSDMRALFTYGLQFTGVCDDEFAKKVFAKQG